MGREKVLGESQNQPTAANLIRSPDGILQRKTDLWLDLMLLKVFSNLNHSMMHHFSLMLTAEPGLQ